MDKRLDTAAIASEINARGRKAVAATDNDHLLSELTRLALDPASGPILVCFFSNGSFGGIIKAFSDLAAAQQTAR